MLGWKAGEDKKSTYGHVVMYIGNGQVIDAQGPRDVLNGSIKTRPLSSMIDRIKYVKKI